MIIGSYALISSTYSLIFSIFKCEFASVNFYKYSGCIISYIKKIFFKEISFFLRKFLQNIRTKQLKKIKKERTRKWGNAGHIYCGGIRDKERKGRGGHMGQQSRAKVEVLVVFSTKIAPMFSSNLCHMHLFFLLPSIFPIFLLIVQIHYSKTVTQYRAYMNYRSFLGVTIYWKDRFNSTVSLSVIEYGCGFE